MATKLTSTEVARRFGEILAEVEHGEKTIVVMRNGEPVAELRPLKSGGACTVSQFAELWSGDETDPDGAFAQDLDSV